MRMEARSQEAGDRITPVDDLAPQAASQPLFVVGVWRSGTSLLYALLNQHPEIALLYEGDLPLFWPLFVLRRRDWAARWDFWNSSLRRHALDDVKQRFQVPADAATATGLAYREYAAFHGATVWGDKSPTYHSHLGRLAEVFPQARFLII